MTTLHPPRRAVVGIAIATSLMVAGAAAYAETAATSGCPATYTDPAGDSGLADPGTNPVTGDDDLDIVAVTHSVDAGLFTTSVKLVQFRESGPDASFGDRYVSSFTVAKKVVTVTAERDFSGFGTVKGSATVAGVAATFPVKVVQDVKGNTISAVIAAADLEKAVGTPLAGQAFSAMSAVSRSIYPSNAGPSVGALFDTATAPATAAYAFGTACGGGGGAGTVPTTSPSATPTPTGTPSPTPTTPSAGASVGLPAPDCGLAKDPKADAHPLNANAPADPDLDLTYLTFQTTADALVAYAKVDKLGAGPSSSTDGHRFTLYFTHNKHVFALAGSAYKNAQNAQVKDGLASTGQFSHVTQLSVDGPALTDPNGRTNPGFVASGLTFTFDQKNSYVIAKLPLADIEKYGKAPVAGATLTAVYGTSATDTDVLSSQADVLPDGAPTTLSKLTYAAGDNHCFAPPVPPLTSVGDVKAQFGDTAAVAAKLVDAAGAPVANTSVTFALGAARAEGTTGPDGIAKAALVVKDKAGPQTLQLTAGTTTATAPFTVLIEKTVLKATGAKGVVTATLLDDDRKPVSGQSVTFTSGAKKVTVKTSANGVAKATFPVGSTVSVAYAGLAGQYSASKTSARA